MSPSLRPDSFTTPQQAKEALQKADANTEALGKLSDRLDKLDRSSRIQVVESAVRLLSGRLSVTEQAVAKSQQYRKVFLVGLAFVLIASLASTYLSHRTSYRLHTVFPPIVAPAAQ